MIWLPSSHSARCAATSAVRAACWSGWVRAVLTCASMSGRFQPNVKGELPARFIW
jgi:hypothetical protein